MKSNHGNELVCEDFRRLFGRKPLPRFHTTRIVGECIVELVEKIALLILVACLCFVVAGFSLFLIQRPAAAETSATTVATPDRVKSGPAPDVSRPSKSVSAVLPSETSDAFFLRVGSFRDASNARRVVESLQRKSMAVRSDVLAGGLHVVTMGPFPGKDAAEDAAREVQEVVGVDAQVFRQAR
jgi:cell division protein FtsN